MIAWDHAVHKEGQKRGVDVPQLGPARALRRHRVMTRLTQRSQHIAVLVVVVLTTGCGGTAPAPAASAPEDAIRTSFSVYTHCGIDSIRIGGRWWHAETPLYKQAGSGPPAGWSDPYQEGILEMDSAERAVFEAHGQRVVFVPASVNEPVRVCR